MVTKQKYKGTKNIEVKAFKKVDVSQFLQIDNSVRSLAIAKRNKESGNSGNDRLEVDGGGDTSTVGDLLVGDAGDISDATPSQSDTLLEFKILETAYYMRQQRGIRDDNFGRYRVYCAQRLSRLKMEELPEPPSATEAVDDNCSSKAVVIPNQFRFEDLTKLIERKLLCLLVATERTWSSGMEHKADNSRRVQMSAKLEESSKRRLRKAADYAERLRNLCGARCDARSRFEAEAYNHLMSSLSLIERKSWEAATVDAYGAVGLLQILKRLSSADILMNSIFSHFLDQANTSIRICRYQLARKGVEVSEVLQQQEMLLSCPKAPKSETLKQSCELSTVTVDWRGHKDVCVPATVSTPLSDVLSSFHTFRCCFIALWGEYETCRPQQPLHEAVSTLVYRLKNLESLEIFDKTALSFTSLQRLTTQSLPVIERCFLASVGNFNNAESDETSSQPQNGPTVSSSPIITPQVINSIFNSLHWLAAEGSVADCHHVASLEMASFRLLNSLLSSIRDFLTCDNFFKVDKKRAKKATKKEKAKCPSGRKTADELFELLNLVKRHALATGFQVSGADDDDITTEATDDLYPLTDLSPTATDNVPEWRKTSQRIVTTMMDSLDTMHLITADCRALLTALEFSAADEHLKAFSVVEFIEDRILSRAEAPTFYFPIEAKASKNNANTSHCPLHYLKSVFEAIQQDVLNKFIVTIRCLLLARAAKAELLPSKDEKSADAEGNNTIPAVLETAQGAVNERSLKQKRLLNKIDANGATKHHLCEDVVAILKQIDFPPHGIAFPCKPVLYDLAFSHYEPPALYSCGDNGGEQGVGLIGKLTKWWGR